MENNKKITVNDLLKMNPGLSEKLESALKSYGKPYNQITVATESSKLKNDNQKNINLIKK